MEILFVAGFGPIVQDLNVSKKLYQDVLGLPLKGDDYLSTNEAEGVKEFALWPLSQAAESCFGVSEWPNNLPVPQAWLEFDVADIEAATSELESQGYTLLVSARKPSPLAVARLPSRATRTPTRSAVTRRRTSAARPAGEAGKPGPPARQGHEEPGPQPKAAQHGSCKTLPPSGQ